MWDKRKKKELKIYDEFRAFTVSVLRKSYSVILQIDCNNQQMAVIPENLEEVIEFKNAETVIAEALTGMWALTDENVCVVTDYVRDAVNNRDNPEEESKPIRIEGHENTVIEGEVMAFTSSFVFLCLRDISLQEKYLKWEESLNESKPRNKSVFVRTFGHFDVFIDDEPVTFSNAKAKELLALLVDRAGGVVTSSEAIGLLWSEEPVEEGLKARYRKTAYELRGTLRDHELDDILFEKRGQRGINRGSFACDYYQLLEGDKKAKETFADTYMPEYEWAEETLAKLLILTEA
ncbi:MAG: hypothetical protein HUJ69_04665 [Lachnospiraceae bacterium]|nr:hypothetical protein [Lachnospiraceae bacterium]